VGDGRDLIADGSEREQGPLGENQEREPHGKREPSQELAHRELCVFEKEKKQETEKHSVSGGQYLGPKKTGDIQDHDEAEGGEGTAGKTLSGGEQLEKGHPSAK